MSSAVMTLCFSLTHRRHRSGLSVIDVFSGLWLWKVVTQNCHAGSLTNERKTEQKRSAVVATYVIGSQENIFISGDSFLMVFKRCSIIGATAKLFCVQLSNRWTKNSTWNFSVRLVITALTCKLRPRFPKKSLICSRWRCGRYFMAQSITIKHEAESTCTRANCIQECTLTE